MKELDESEQRTFLSHELLSRWIGYFLVIGMMVCLGSSAAMLLNRFIAGPAGYLPWLTGLIAIEGIITQSRMRRTVDMNLSPAAYVLVEWVVAAFLIRVVIYIYSGWGSFLVDLARVQEQFILSFLNGEFVFTLIICLLAWASARMYTEDLRDLGDDRVLLLIRDGEVASNRALIRKRITSRVLAIGFGMVLLTTLANIDIAQFNWEMFQSKIKSLSLVVYFVMGLILMSLAHFAALRAAWAWERIPIDVHIGRRWVINSLLMLSIIGLVAFLLPARYSVGLFEAVSYILYFFSLFIYAIFALIQIPIFLIISLFGQLFQTDTPRITDRIPPPPQLPAQAYQGNETEMSLIFKSILFWVVLIGVIVYAIIQFIRQNKGLVQVLKQKRGWQLILQAFAWVRKQMQGVRTTISTMVEKTIQQMASMVRRNRSGEAWNYLNLRSLTPQQRIRFYYLALIRRSSEVGITRKSSQTPYEYAQTLAGDVAGNEQELNEMTEAFIEARYSTHPISPEQVGRTRQAWDRLRQILKGKKARDG